MKRLLLVFVACVTCVVPSMLSAQDCCPDDTTEVIAVYHIYNTIDSLKYMGSVAHEACYNAEEHVIVKWNNLDTYAILHGCGSKDDFPARLQKKFRTEKLPQLCSEREHIVLTLPDGVKLTTREMSVYGIH